jgi:hypothetical protein
LVPIWWGRTAQPILWWIKTNAMPSGLISSSIFPYWHFLWNWHIFSLCLYAHFYYVLGSFRIFPPFTSLIFGLRFVRLPYSLYAFIQSRLIKSPFGFVIIIKWLNLQ